MSSRSVDNSHEGMQNGKEGEGARTSGLITVIQNFLPDKQHTAWGHQTHPFTRLQDAEAFLRRQLHPGVSDHGFFRMDSPSSQ